MPCTPSGTTTTKLTLCKPASGETGWAAAINGNWDTIDSILGSLSTTAGVLSTTNAGPHSVGGATVAGTTLALYGTGQRVLHFNDALPRLSVGSTALAFYDNAGSNERMRLTDSGILAIGTTVTTGAAAGDIALSATGQIRANFAGTQTGILGVDANSVLQLGGNTSFLVAVSRTTAIAASANNKGVIFADTGTAGQLVFFDGVTGARYKLTGTAF